MTQASMLWHLLSKPLPRTVLELHTPGVAPHLPLLHYPLHSHPGQGPLGSHTGYMLLTSPQLCIRPDLHLRLTFCLVYPFPSLLLSLQSLPRGLSQGHSPWPRLVPRLRAPSWFPQLIFSSSITAGRDVTVYHWPEIWLQSTPTKGN